MTDLQTSLIIIGGVIVIGVISFNKWQEFKARKSVERAFAPTSSDALMSGAAEAATADDAGVRQEPTWATDAAAGHSTAEHSTTAHGTASMRQAIIKELPVDALIDCTIPLALEGQLAGDKIITPIQSLRHVGNKPVHFIGQCDDGNWEPIAHRGVYSALRAGVQLANRTNALNELEYSELIMRLRHVADEIGAEPDVPDMAEVMHTARALHQFVTEYDAKLSVNIHSNGAPWAISTLLMALEKYGFDLRPDGRLVMPDGDGGILFSLSTNVSLADDTSSRLTLLLDVPCVMPVRDGFGAMIACAQELAGRLDGTVVDDGNQALSQAALTEIAEQVRAFYDDMETANIPAGSGRALRLFS